MDSPKTANANSRVMKDTSITSVLNINIEDERKKIDTPETSLDNSTCNTPVYSSNMDLEAPLSPVLSNSKHSMKYIARKKSRIKLMNKFSQSSNVASQLTLTPTSNIAAVSNRIENISPITVRTEIDNLNSISKENTQLNTSTKSDSCDVGERMKKIKELQRNKKFCYNIETVASKSVSPVNTPSTSYNTEQRGDDVTFKIPESPKIVSNAASLKTSDNINYEIKHQCPIVIPDVKLNIGFETGAGKKIELSEKALKRAAKIFDDITDLPSESALSTDNNICELDIKRDNIKCKLDSNTTKTQPSDKSVDFKNDTSCKNTIGFKTANGNMLPLSEQSLGKVKNIFEDIFELSLYEEKPEISNKPDDVKEEYLDLKSNSSILNSINVNSDQADEHFKVPVVTVPNKMNRVLEDICAESKNINFTQANDSQMCWVADNAASMVELMNNQWSPSSSNSQHNSGTSLSSDSSKNLQATLLKNDQDMSLSQETDLLLGNLTILDRTSSSNSCSNEESKSSSSQLNRSRSNDSEEFSSQENFDGFTSDEKLQSLQILELYKHAIKYIEADLEKNVFYPISFNFDDVQRYINYKNQNRRYSLRSRKKPTLTQVSNKRKSTRGKQEKETVKRRKSSNSDENTKRNKRKSVEQNSASSSNSNSQNISSRTRGKSSMSQEENEETSEKNNTSEVMANIFSVFESTFSDISAKICNESALNSQIHASTKSVVNTSENQLNSELKMGFSTASGRKVNISSDSLQKVKHIFDVCNFLNEKDCSNETVGSSSVSKNTSEEEVTRSQCIINDALPVVPKINNNLGFSTASGKSVKISEESLKKSRQLFEDCELMQENIAPEMPSVNNNYGFSTASGKSVKISEESLKKVRNIFDNLDLLEEDKQNQMETPKDCTSFGFSTASGKGVEISEKSLRKARKLFDECDLSQEHTVPEKTWNSAFSTASGKKVAVNKETVNKVINLFDEDNISNCETPKNRFNVGFSTASGRKVQVSEDALKQTRNFFDNCEDSVEDKQISNLETPNNENLQTSKMTMNFGFATASGKKVNVSEESLKIARTIFEDNDELENNENVQKSVVSQNYPCGFATASGNTVKISEESLKKIQNIFQGCEENKDIEKLSKEDETNSRCNDLQKTPYASPTVTEKRTPVRVNNESTPVLRNKLLASRGSKKRSLGVSSCRQISISDNSLKKARLVFDEMDTPKKREDMNINNNNVVPKFTTPVRNISTPVLTRNVTPSVLTPQNQNVPNQILPVKQSTQLQNTPVKILSPLRNDQLCSDDLTSSPFIFKEATEGDPKKWKQNLKKEYDMLKLKMSVIETRMQILNNREETNHDRRQQPGQLFQQKTGNSKRISLQEIVKNRRPGKNNYERCLAMGVKPSVLDISAENASKLHFHLPWYPNPDRTYPAVIRTEDNAILVPNQQNLVGITEIEAAFRAIPGIDPALIPNGWTANHYKWIVWKLASMERNYLDVFADYLSVENVVAQLKYRYDREIDRAQRPALRKILECDDTAAKRMVLCVSSIIKLSEGKYDLELTDGWYSIRTSMDGPLNSLVDRAVIKIGMKLMIQGAELLNCEGCCPLETPANVRLQIHYNSTRRAAWYTRLGYQRNPGPMCISLRTINGNGGPIGLTCAYVTRVYPISYMERLAETLVWRNRKAEQRRANQWESRQAQVMERLQAKVQEELEIEWKKGKRENTRGKVRVKDIQDVHCARTLYEYLEDSNDPDSLREMMTADQCIAVQEYQSRLTMERQAEVTSKLRQKLDIENIQPRNVSSVFKLLLLDVNSPYHSRALSIWRPKDSHLQELKEGVVVRIYNLTTRNNGTLSSVPRTQFDLDLDFDTEKFEKFNRNVVPISQTVKPEFKPLFGEFDTVGMIVFIDVQQTNQSLWLADENFRFLLIQIREGPETCCLLDGMVLGKIIALTNLVYQKPTKSYGEALANHCTTISSYPNQSYLQYFMKEFIENLPQDVDKYLEECKDQVEIYLAQKLLNSNVLKTFILDCDADLTTKPTSVVTQTQQNGDGLTLSDEEMSLIDTQML